MSVKVRMILEFDSKLPTLGRVLEDVEARLSGGVLTRDALTDTVLVSVTRVERLDVEHEHAVRP